jgi:hypothetical protein
MISDTCHVKNEIATSACGLLAMTLFFRSSYCEGAKRLWQSQVGEKADQEMRSPRRPVT